MDKEKKKKWNEAYRNKQKLKKELEKQENKPIEKEETTFESQIEDTIKEQLKPEEVHDETGIDVLTYEDIEKMIDDKLIFFSKTFTKQMKDLMSKEQPKLSTVSTEQTTKKSNFMEDLMKTTALACAPGIAMRAINQLTASQPMQRLVSGTNQQSQAPNVGNTYATQYGNIL